MAIVEDPNHLTDGEKTIIAEQIRQANKDNFPEGTTVTVSDNGTVTVTYPDGSVDVIKSSMVIYGGQPTDGGKNTNRPAKDKGQAGDQTQAGKDASAAQENGAKAGTLPRTGENNSGLALVGGLMVAAALGLAGIRRKKEDE